MKYTKDMIQDALERSVAETFELMTFILTDPNYKDDCPGPQPTDVLSHITFTSSQFTGELTLTLPEEMAQEVTCNLFGNSVECTLKDTIEDTIAELSNTIIGEFVRNLAGDDEAFQVGLPETADGGICNRESSVCIRFITDSEKAFCTALEITIKDQ